MSVLDPFYKLALMLLLAGLLILPAIRVML